MPQRVIRGEAQIIFSLISVFMFLGRSQEHSGQDAISDFFNLHLNLEQVDRNKDSAMGRRLPYGTPVQPLGTRAGNVATSLSLPATKWHQGTKKFQGKNYRFLRNALAKYRDHWNPATRTNSRASSIHLTTTIWLNWWFLRLSSRPENVFSSKFCVQIS